MPLALQSCLALGLDQVPDCCWFDTQCSNCPSKASLGPQTNIGWACINQNLVNNATQSSILGTCPSCPFGSAAISLVGYCSLNPTYYTNGVIPVPCSCTGNLEHPSLNTNYWIANPGSTVSQLACMNKCAGGSSRVNMQCIPNLQTECPGPRTFNDSDPNVGLCTYETAQYSVVQTQVTQQNNEIAFYITLLLGAGFLGYGIIGVARTIPYTNLK